MQKGNVAVEIERDNMKKFERMAKHSGFDSVVLLNSVLRRWLAENYKAALTVPA